MTPRVTLRKALNDPELLGKPWRGLKLARKILEYPNLGIV